MPRQKPIPSGVEYVSRIRSDNLIHMVLRADSTIRYTSVPPAINIVTLRRFTVIVPADQRPARRELFAPSVTMNTEICGATTGHFQPTTIKPMCAPASTMTVAVLRRYPARWTVPTASGVRSAAAARPSMVRSTQAITIGGAGRATAI